MAAWMDPMRMDVIVLLVTLDALINIALKLTSCVMEVRDCLDGTDEIKCG